MNYFDFWHDRKSIRLPGYNYSQPGYCFVTICTQDRECLFGDIVNDKIYHSPLGISADLCWKMIPFHFPNVRLDEYVIMPNHIHGILEIVDINDRAGVNSAGVAVGADHDLPLQPLPLQQKKHYFQRPLRHSLSSFIRGFKQGVTLWCLEHFNEPSPWQGNFYDSIIRDQNGLERVRQYIRENPKNWETDFENPRYRSGILRPERNLLRSQEHASF